MTRQTRYRPTLLPSDRPVPPPMPGVRHVRLWKLGILVADDDLRDHVEDFFHWPMIIVALAILPLLVIEVSILKPAYTATPAADVKAVEAVIAHFETQYGVPYWIAHPSVHEMIDEEAEQLVVNPALAKHLSPGTVIIIQWVLATAGFVIWLAFFIEFFINSAIAESRLEYAKRNWLDIVIILLPLISFLRVLRLARVSRLARTGRAFRLRGVLMKVARYVFSVVIGLEATDRILTRLGVRIQARQKSPEHMTRHELMTEVKSLRKRTHAWQNWHEAHDEYVRAHGGPCYLEPPPFDDEEAVSDTLHE